MSVKNPTFTKNRDPRSRLIILSVLVFLVAYGCGDLLDKTPRGQLTTDSFFLTEEHAIQATNATYAKMRDWNIHVFAFLGLTDIISDDAKKGSTPTDAAFLSELEDLTYDAGNITVNDWWTGNYQGIYRANLAIENIPGIDMNVELRNRLVAENRFLRAYFYFNLVRGYGGVPLITNPLRPDEFFQERESEDAIYNLIIEDLEYAEEHLPFVTQYSSAELGRATKGAAQAMLARVYLYLEDYTNAEEYAREVIDSNEYALLNDYSMIFTREGENSSESIFEVQNTAREDGEGSSQYSQVQGVRGNPNLGWGFNNPSRDLMQAYEPGDPRQQATILHVWEALPDGSGQVVYKNVNMIDERYNQKAFAPVDRPGTIDDGPVNVRRIRYSDVLLIAAEAAYRNGAEQDARDFLNEVRVRARGGMDVTLGVQYEEMASYVSNRLGNIDSDSNVFVRYVNPGSPAGAAGIESFEHSTRRIGFTNELVVTQMDLITAVDGNEIITIDDFHSELQNFTAGETVTVDILRLEQLQANNWQTTSEELQFDIELVALLPDVNAGGQALLDAIWHERRVELAMEQKRWFDLIRQGRAPQVMQALGVNFETGKHELFPIPVDEINLSQGMLEQNDNW